jgi:hypothetical protein
VGHGRAARVAGSDHAGRAEHLAADVVAVDGVEAGLGGGHGAVVEADDDHGGVLESLVLVVRVGEGVGHGVHVDGLGSRVQVAQGVEVVDQGLQEDAGGRHPAGVGDAGVAGQRAQQLRGAQPAGGDQVVGGPEAGIEPCLSG